MKNPKRVAAGLRAKYPSATGYNVEWLYHGAGVYSALVHAENTDMNRIRFPRAKVSPQGTLLIVRKQWVGEWV